MASPIALTPARPGAAINVATPTTASRRTESPFRVKRFSTTSINEEIHADSPTSSSEASSPFISSIQERLDSPAKENVTPSRHRPHSRIMSGTEIAPLRLLGGRDEKDDADMLSPAKQNTAGKSPRKPIPVKRFPVRASNATPERPLNRQSMPVMPSMPSMPESESVEDEHKEAVPEDTVRGNEGLKQAIEIFEDESTVLEKDVDGDADTTSMTSSEQPRIDVDDDHTESNETMISEFSTFSAVPSMTMFAKLGQTPTTAADPGATPKPARGRPDPSPTRTSRPPAMNDPGNTSFSLIDFTEQLKGLTASFRAPSPVKGGRISPTKRTPQHGSGNLLDFDIPPMPTPRSIPTVTPRELESLKSSFLSEISGLKASLLGKEAEVTSLKTAVADAEKRVGHCMEQLREANDVKNALSEEKDTWSKRGREMEAVLRNVKEEIMNGQREREQLEHKLEESAQRRAAAEFMAQEAESKLAAMRAGRAMSQRSPEDHMSPDRGARNSGSHEVEIAVERVARELHALYKQKHETKVAALKKNYEHRWEKKVHELERQIQELTEDNEKIKMNREATMTRVDPAQLAELEQRRAQAAADSAEIKHLNAEIDKLEAQVGSMQQDNRELIQVLEAERIEKGELVQLAEEMMAMQQSYIQPEPEPEPVAAPTPAPTLAPAPTPARRPAPSPRGTPKPSPAKAKPGEFAKPPRPSSIALGRSSSQRMSRPLGGLPRAHTESRIGGPAHERIRSVGSQGGLPRPGSGMAMRSGIMNSIERMGSYKGRGH